MNKILYQDSEITKLQIISKTYGVFEFIIDTEDYPKIKDRVWGVSKKKKTTPIFYVRRNEEKKGKTQTIYLHQLVMGKKNVDHINQNTMDNRKVNLRACSVLENNLNRQAQRNSVSGIKGVHYRRDVQKWRAVIHVKRKKISLGYFATANEAAIAYNTAALKYYGNMAVLNKTDIS